MNEPAIAPTSAAKPDLRLALGALGVVFGDIGTSPLYAFRESFIGPRKLPIDDVHVLGVLSLIAWALILVVTVKYVLITMHADNHGEGGSFALLSLIRRAAPASRMLPAISIAALLATSLFYGDSVITPAISVLSAVEGVTLANAGLAVVVIPVTVAITLALFGIQHRGAGVVGRFFGPVMLAWFAVIGILGLMNVLGRPGVVLAASPAYALRMLAEDPMRAFFTLGTVVLTITGAEALYADMGQFGRVPISRAWLALVLPALLLCYAGQAALVLNRPAAIDQAFYLLAPGWALWPLLVLATAATVIASQSVITGAFSITAQAIRLGYLPRLNIVHTSASESGQVYCPTVNLILCGIVIGLVFGFRSSTALAAAYGFAVTSTMVLTTLMMGFVMFRVWHLNKLWAVPVYAILLVFDLSLFAASSTKIPDGAWLPLALAALMMLLFTTWSRGLGLVIAAIQRDAVPVDAFLRDQAAVTRVPGLAVYLSRGTDTVPVALRRSVKYSHVLHEHVLLVTIQTALRPRRSRDARLRFQEIAPGIGRAVLTFGFLDEPDVPDALTLLPPAWREDPSRTTYVLGRQNLTSGPNPGMAPWRAGLFATMMRLSGSASSAYFRLPPDRVVELGNEVVI